MAGLVPAIHVFVGKAKAGTWMLGDTWREGALRAFARA
jgi:hypothetical protein